jgi:serine/threonine protein kinase
LFAAAGCASQLTAARLCAGDEASLSFTLAYAAPEVVAAYKARAHTHVTDPATDVWALGVIAFEMLTGTRAFPLHMPQEEVAERILGHEPLPWEGPDAAQQLRKLRVFKPIVLDCLQRDPAQRPPIRTVMQSWMPYFRPILARCSRCRCHAGRQCAADQS